MKCPPLSGVVLAGGQSRRMGQDKALLRLWGPAGPTLLEVVTARLAAVCDEVLVVSAAPREDWPALEARLVFDRFPGGGALGGIYTGLAEAAHPYALTVGCDMPFLHLALLHRMAKLPRDYDVLIPRLPRSGLRKQGGFHLEPLHAIYGRACLEPMLDLLQRGGRQIIRFFPQVRVRYLEPDEWAALDPQGLSFRSLNTPQDVAAIMTLLRDLPEPQ